MTLQAELNPDKKIDEDKYDNNKGGTEVTFVSGNDLSIAYLRVCDTTGGSCPAPAIANMSGWLRKV